MNVHEKMWDRYVENHPLNPGQEWGSPGHWESIFSRFFYGVGNWKRAIEIGAGAGKYTKKVLDTSHDCQIAALDVSKKFLDVLMENVAKHPYLTPDVKVRVHPFYLNYPAEESHCSPLRSICEKKDWPLETVDAVYSIDAMVHVEWQIVVSYIQSAYEVLRQGGVLIMTVANGASAQGFDYLLKTTRAAYKGNCEYDGKFHFASPDLVRTALSGYFKIEFMDDRGRDIYFVATKQ